ncbi:MAG: anti-sigma factor family protein [Ktedonobacterales bacterium]
MTCARSRRYLQLYVDRRLAPGYLSSLEAHLAQCAGCRQELHMLETIAEVYVEPEPVEVPPDLTVLIMARVAQVERLRARVGSRPYGICWADALVALLLASVSTLLFVLLDPSLRLAVPAAFMRSFPTIVSLLLARGPGSIAWSAWIAWVLTGTLLTLWLAGAEVRSSWRRALSQRMPQLPHLPQSFELW